MYYFKHRSLATGIATSGSGLGSTVFPIIMYLIIQKYGWQGSFFIVAGLNLHLFVFAALLRPVPKDLESHIDKQERLQTSSQGMTQNGTELTEFNDESAPNNQIIIEAETYPMIKTEDDKNPEKVTCVQGMAQHFRSVLQTDYIIYWFSNVCWNAGISIVLLFFPEYALSLGLDKEYASLVLTMVGAGSCIGCVLGGVLGSVKYLNRIWVYIVGNIGTGLFTLAMTWKPFHTFTGLMIVSFCLGLMFGIILGLLIVVTSDLLGLEALGTGFGYLMLANGIGIFGGPPLAGKTIKPLQEEPFEITTDGLLISMSINVLFRKCVYLLTTITLVYTWR